MAGVERLPPVTCSSRLQLFPGRLLQTVSFDKTKGYYIANTSDFIPGWQQGQQPYIQIPDLKVTQWSGATFFICNRDFSFKNLIYQTQWQKRSAGSFVPALYYDHTRYAFGLAGTYSLQKDYNARLGLGYYYTFIIRKHLFVSPNIVPSLGIRYSVYHSEENGLTTQDKNSYFTRFLEGGLKCGYNATRWVAGIGFSFNVSWYNEDRSHVLENDRYFGILYLGYRFGTPRLISNAYKEFEKRLP